METLTPLIPSLGGGQLTLFPEVSHANRFPTPGSNEARTMTVTSGRNSLNVLMKLGRRGSYLKTFTASLLITEEWSSSKCLQTWKVSATKHKRLLLRLQQSMPSTGVIGFGLLPTPTTVQINRRELAMQLAEQNLPLHKRRDKEGNGRQFTVLDALIYWSIRGEITTPLFKEQQPNETLRHCITQASGTPCPNPEFLEAMMGYPIGWTEMPPLATP